MSRPQLMHSVDDGLILGAVERSRQVCNVCGHTTMCIFITKITLPKGLEPSNSLIAFRDGKDQVNKRVVPLRYIGIGCGCYARFHRQVAHIETRRECRSASHPG